MRHPFSNLQYLRTRWHRAAPALGGSLMLCAVLLTNTAVASCPPTGQTKATLLQLKSMKWQISDAVERQNLALGLLDCLADPDPVWRDELAFEALSHWMRSAQLTPATLHRIRTTLLAKLKPEGRDEAGFAQPFAALVLSEVARVDRKQAFLSPEERQALLNQAAQYLSTVRDYRGFHETQGWRHGVAHGADLMLQLALNPQLGRSQHQTILSAIASQVAPVQHFYHYGESERLMTPVFYLGRAKTLDSSDWDAWFKGLQDGLQKTAPNSDQHLAQRHNLIAFLQALYVSLQESGEGTQRQTMLPALTRVLKQIQ